MTTTPELWIAIVEPQQSWQRLTDAQRRELLATPGLTGVSVRVPTTGSRQLAADVHSAGLLVDVEMWCGEEGRDDATPADAADGKLAGAKLATNAAVHNAAWARANAEHAVWRDDSRPGERLANPGGHHYMTALIDEYFERNTKSGLAYLGFYNPRKYYKSADRDGDGVDDSIVPEHVKRRMPRVWVMVYSASERSIRRTLARARKLYPEHWLGAYITPPRRDAKTGRRKGNLAAWRKVVDEGLVQGLTVYIGLDQHRDDDHLANPWTTLFGGDEPVVAWLGGIGGQLDTRHIA